MRLSIKDKQSWISMLRDFIFIYFMDNISPIDANIFTEITIY